MSSASGALTRTEHHPILSDLLYRVPSALVNKSTNVSMISLTSLQKTGNTAD